MNAFVKDIPLNVPFLEEVARLYVGRPVRVMIVNTTEYRGEAGKHGGMDTVKISGEQPASLFAYTFFHEVAHCVLHQSDTTPDSKGVVFDVGVATTKAQGKPHDRVLELIRQRIEREENEADSLAHELAHDHWKRCGPLLEVARLRYR